MPDTVTIYSDIPDFDTLGGRLSRARDASGLSEADLARRIGVRTTTIMGWESDRAQPRANRLSTLAGVLSVSLSWLLHGVGTGPDDDRTGEVADGLTLRLDRLKRLQRETAEIIAQLEREIGRTPQPV